MYKTSKQRQIFLDLGSTQLNQSVEQSFHIAEYYEKVAYLKSVRIIYFTEDFLNYRAPSRWIINRIVHRFRVTWSDSPVQNFMGCYSNKHCVLTFKSVIEVNYYWCHPVVTQSPCVH